MNPPPNMASVELTSPFLAQVLCGGADRYQLESNTHQFDVIVDVAEGVAKGAQGENLAEPAVDSNAVICAACVSGHSTLLVIYCYVAMRCRLPHGCRAVGSAAETCSMLDQDTWLAQFVGMCAATSRDPTVMVQASIRTERDYVAQRRVTQNRDRPTTDRDKQERQHQLRAHGDRVSTSGVRS